MDYRRPYLKNQTKIKQKRFAEIYLGVVMAYSCNLSTQKADAGGLPQVQGYLVRVYLKNRKKEIKDT